MLAYTDLKPGKLIVLDNEPYVVLEYSFVRKQQRKPVVQTKIRSIVSGRVVEKSFYPRDVVEEVELEKKEMKFLYINPQKGEFWFCETNDPSKRFALGQDVMGGGAVFLKSNSLVNVEIWRDKIIGVKLPIKVELKVTEAPPAVKGNTAQGVTKQAKLETGAFINVPIFINEGDIVRVNTEKGEYVERVEKSK